MKNKKNKFITNDKSNKQLSLRHVLSRSLGNSEHELVDHYSFELESGDTLVLCSDGLHEALSDDEIIAVSVKNKSENLSKSLITAALNNMTRDNTTAITVQIN